MARNFKIKKNVPKYIDKKQRLHSKKQEPQVTKKMKTRSFQTLLSKKYADYSEQDFQILNSYIDLYNSGYSCSQLGFGTQVPGDMNQDGILNIQDVISLVNITLGGQPFEDFPCLQSTIGDMNQDGGNNVLDIIQLVLTILDLPGFENPEASDYTSEMENTPVGYILRHTFDSGFESGDYFLCNGGVASSPGAGMTPNADFACREHFSNPVDPTDSPDTYRAILLGQIADEVCWNEYYSNFGDDTELPFWLDGMNVYGCLRESSNIDRDNSREQLGINWNYRGCPSGAALSNTNQLQSYEAYFDPNTNKPFVNHDFNCWRPSQQGQPLYEPNQVGNASPCLACYDPGLMDLNGVDVPAYVYHCDGDFSREWIGDFTCGGEAGYDLDGDGTLCNCQIKPDYVCLHEPNVSYGIDSDCQGQCTGVGNSCVDKAISCCLHNFPKQWFDSYLTTYQEPVDFNNDSYDMHFYLNREGIYQGNKGPRRNFSGVEDSPGAWEPAPSTDYGWDTLKCEGDSVSNGNWCNDENALAGNSCGDNGSGICVVESLYEQPVIAIFGQSDITCGVEDNLLACSECSGNGVDDCDIRGLLPKYEHVPITAPFSTNNITDVLQGTSSWVDFFYWYSMLGDYGNAGYLGYACNGGDNDGEYCESAVGTPGTPFYGCGAGENDGVTCEMNIKGPPTLFQQVLYDDFTSGPANDMFVDHYHHIYFDNNSIAYYPSIPDQCGQMEDTDDSCNNYRYSFPSFMQLPEERFLIKIYDPQTHNDYVAGCINTGDENLFGTVGVPNEINYQINLDAVCEGASYDESTELWTAGRCSDDNRMCLEDKHCIMKSMAKYCNYDSETGQIECESHSLNPISCLFPGCTDESLLACNYDPIANVDDGSCVYKNLYCFDNDEDGLPCCDEAYQICPPPFQGSEDILSNMIQCGVCDGDGDCSQEMNNLGGFCSNDVNIECSEDGDCGDDGYCVLCDPVCGCPTNQVDHCEICISEGVDANWCYGQLENNTCSCLVCSDESDTTTCNQLWDGSNPSIGQSCANGNGVCVTDPISPPESTCWDSTGSNTGFDCNGQCFGGFVDSCGSCAEDIDVNKILCHIDFDEDGLGCDPNIGYDCQIELFCPSYNYLCEQIPELNCHENFNSTCPCIEGNCWQDAENGLDEFDDCVGFIDGCMNPHCSNQVNNETYYDCRGPYPDGHVWCIDDNGAEPSMGYKTDDCGACIEMNCCDSETDPNCTPPENYQNGYWLLNNGSYLVTNPCEEIFGFGWVPNNPFWNQGCVDCKGYPSLHYGAENAHPYVVDGNVDDSHFYDATGVQNDSHCCKPDSTDECGVCFSVGIDPNFYKWFADYDHDGLGFGPVLQWCGYSQTPGGNPASPTYYQCSCEIFDCDGDGSPDNTDDVQSCCDLANGNIGDDYSPTCCILIPGFNSSYSEYGNPGYCYVNVGNQPTHTDFHVQYPNSVDDSPNENPDWIPFYECGEFGVDVVYDFEGYENEPHCVQDVMPSCPTNLADCTLQCYGGGLEHEPIFDLGCGECGVYPNVYSLSVELPGLGNFQYGYLNNGNIYDPEINYGGNDYTIPTDYGYYFCPGAVLPEIENCPNITFNQWDGSYDINENGVSYCLNPNADNYLFDKHPCLSDNGLLSQNCEGSNALCLDSIGDDSYCGFLNIITPTIESNVIFGQPFELRLNSTSLEPSCNGTQGEESECYHNIDVNLYGTNLAKSYLIRSDGLIMGTELINVNHIQDGTSFVSLQPDVGWQSGDENYTYNIEVYYPNNGSDINSCDRGSTFNCVGFDSVSDLSLTEQIIGCMDDGTLPSCATICMESSDPGVFTCVGGPADGSICSCLDGETSCNTSNVCNDPQPIHMENCFMGRPNLDCFGNPYGYSQDSENNVFHSACDYNSLANTDNGTCSYRELHGSDCDNDGYPCLSDQMCSCPYGDGDVYTGNHPYQGFPVPSCPYVKLSEVPSDYLESGINHCLCSNPSTWNQEDGTHSFEIGVCKFFEFEGRNVCEGGEFDYFGDLGESGHECRIENIDTVNGGHVDCPNLIRPDGVRYTLGDIVNGVRDNCGICLDSMCGLPAIKEDGTLNLNYHPLNFQSYQDSYVDPTNLTWINPCRSNSIVPTNPFWNMNCSGCIDESALNYGSLESEVCSSQISDPSVQYWGNCDDGYYTLEEDCDGVWTFDEESGVVVANVIETTACDRPCNGGDLNNEPLYDADFGYGFACSGICKLNPYVQCGICDREDDTCDEICRDSHEPRYEFDECMYDGFTYEESLDESYFSLYDYEVSPSALGEMFNSQALNCCCDFDYGCSDEKSINYDSQIIKDCSSNLLKHCLFGFDQSGIPLDAHVRLGQISINIDTSTECIGCITNLNYNSGGYHYLKNNSYIKVGQEIIEVTNLTPDDPHSQTMSATLGRGLFETDVVSHNSSEVYVEVSSLCDRSCCESYVVPSCTQPNAWNYYCHGSYGLGNIDDSLCPNGVLPNEDDFSMDNFDHVIVGDCDGVVGGDNIDCCLYAYDCNGDVCNGDNCDHTTGNAYYDFCGKCVGGNTQDNDGNVLFSGYYHRGCGCDSTDPRAGDLDLLEYYYDGDADGFGCELDTDGNNFATITISQLDVYNAIQLRYNNLSDGVVDEDYLDLSFYPRCEDDPSQLCWKKPDLFSDEPEDGELQCSTGSCIGFNYVDKYCPNCQKQGYVSEPHPFGHTDCIPNRYVAAWMGSYDDDSQYNSLHDKETPYVPQWFTDFYSNADMVEDGFIQRPCVTDEDCTIYCPVVGLEGEFEQYNIAAQEGLCDSTNYCKYPGWIYDGRCNPNSLDQACDCVHNFVDCAGNCIEPDQGSHTGSCLGDCGGSSIGCTAYYDNEGGDLVEATPWIIINGEVCGESPDYDDCGYTISCDTWLRENCGVGGLSFCEDFNSDDYDEGRAWMYLYDINSHSAQLGNILKDVEDYRKVPHICNFEPVFCRDYNGDLDDDICESISPNSRCNQYGYCDIVNGFDCNCDCRDADLEDDHTNSAKLDGCGVCYGGNTSYDESYATDPFACAESYTGEGGRVVEHNPDIYDNGQWTFGPNLDCACECKYGTPRYNEVHSECELDENGEPIQNETNLAKCNYGEAGMFFPLGGFGSSWCEGDTSVFCGNQVSEQEADNYCQSLGLGNCFTTEGISYGCGGPNFENPEIWDWTCGCTGGNVPLIEPDADHKSSGDWCFTCSDSNASQGYEPILFPWCFNQDGSFNDDECFDCSPYPDCSDMCPHACGYHGCTDIYALNYDSRAIIQGGAQCLYRWMWNNLSGECTSDECVDEYYSWYLPGDDYCQVIDDGCDGCTGGFNFDSEDYHYCGGKFRALDWYCENSNLTDCNINYYDPNDSGDTKKVGLNSVSLLDPRYIPICEVGENNQPDLEASQCINGNCVEPSESDYWSGMTIDDLPEYVDTASGYFGNIQLFAHDFTFRTKLDGSIVKSLNENNSIVILLGESGPSVHSDITEIASNTCDESTPHNLVKITFDIQDLYDTSCFGEGENTCETNPNCQWNEQYFVCQPEDTSGYYDLIRNWFHVRMAFKDNPDCFEEELGCVDPINTHIVSSRRNLDGEYNKIQPSSIEICGDPAEIRNSHPRFFSFLTRKKHALPEVDCVTTDESLYSSFIPSDNCKLNSGGGIGETYYGVCSEPSSDSGRCDCSRGSFGNKLFGSPNDDNYAAWDSIWIDDFKMVSGGFRDAFGSLSIINFSPVNEMFGNDGNQLSNQKHSYTIYNTQFEISMVDDLTECNLTHNIFNLGGSSPASVGYYANGCINGNETDATICNESNSDSSEYNPYFPFVFGGPEAVGQLRCWDNLSGFQPGIDTPQSHGVDGGAGMTIDPVSNQISFLNTGDLDFYNHISNVHSKNKIFEMTDTGNELSWWGHPSEILIDGSVHHTDGNNLKWSYDWQPGNLVHAWNGCDDQPGRFNFYSNSSFPDKVSTSYTNTTLVGGNCPCEGISPNHPNDGNCNINSTMFNLYQFPNVYWNEISEEDDELSIFTPSPRDRFPTNINANYWNGEDIEQNNFNPAMATILRWPYEKSQAWGDHYSKQEYSQANALAEQFFQEGSYYYFIAKASGNQGFFSENDCWPYENYTDGGSGYFSDLMSLFGPETPDNQGCFNVYANIKRPPRYWIYALPKKEIASSWNSGTPTYFVWYYKSSGFTNMESDAQTACQMVSEYSGFNCIAYPVPDNPEYLDGSLEESEISDLDWFDYPSEVTPIDEPMWSMRPGREQSKQLFEQNYPSVNISFAVLLHPPQSESSYKIQDTVRNPFCDCPNGRFTVEEGCPSGTQQWNDDVGMYECELVSENCKGEFNYIVGCTDFGADNYCQEATYDNGTCTYENRLYLETCPTDEEIDGDALNCDGYCLDIRDDEGLYSQQQCVEVQDGNVLDWENFNYSDINHIINHPNAYSSGWLQEVSVTGFLHNEDFWSFNDYQICHMSIDDDYFTTTGLYPSPPQSDTSYESCYWAHEYDVFGNDGGVVRFPVYAADQYFGNQFKIVLPDTFEVQTFAYNCPDVNDVGGYCSDDGIIGELLDMFGFGDDGCCLTSSSPCDPNMEGNVPYPGDYCDIRVDSEQNFCNYNSYACRRDCDGVCRDICHFLDYDQGGTGQIGNGPCESPSAWNNMVDNEVQCFNPINLSCEQFNYEGGDCDGVDGCANNEECGCREYSCDYCHWGFGESNNCLGSGNFDCSCEPNCMPCEVASILDGYYWNDFINNEEYCSQQHQQTNWTPGICCPDVVPVSEFNQLGNGQYNLSECHAQNYCTGISEFGGGNSMGCACDVTPGGDLQKMCPGTIYEQQWREACVQTTGFDPVFNTWARDDYQGEFFNYWGPNFGQEMVEFVNQYYYGNWQIHDVCCCNVLQLPNWSDIVPDYPPGCMDDSGICIGDPNYVKTNPINCANPAVYNDNPIGCMEACTEENTSYWGDGYPTYVYKADNYDPLAIEDDGSCTYPYLDIETPDITIDDDQSLFNYYVANLFQNLNIPCEAKIYPHSCAFEESQCSQGTWPGCIDEFQSNQGCRESGWVSLKTDLHGVCYPSTWVGDGFCDRNLRKFPVGGYEFIYPDVNGYPDGFGETAYLQGIRLSIFPNQYLDGEDGELERQDCEGGWLAMDEQNAVPFEPGQPCCNAWNQPFPYSPATIGFEKPKRCDYENPSDPLVWDCGCPELISDGKLTFYEYQECLCYEGRAQTDATGEVCAHWNGGTSGGVANWDSTDFQIGVNKCGSAWCDVTDMCQWTNLELYGAADKWIAWTDMDDYYLTANPEYEQNSLPGAIGDGYSYEWYNEPDPTFGFGGFCYEGNLPNGGSHGRGWYSGNWYAVFNCGQGEFGCDTSYQEDYCSGEIFNTCDVRQALIDHENEQDYWRYIKAPPNLQCPQFPLNNGAENCINDYGECGDPDSRSEDVFDCDGGCYFAETVSDQDIENILNGEVCADGTESSVPQFFDGICSPYDFNNCACGFDATYPAVQECLNDPNCCWEESEYPLCDSVCGEDGCAETNAKNFLCNSCTDAPQSYCIENWVGEPGQPCDATIDGDMNANCIENGGEIYCSPLAYYGPPAVYDCQGVCVSESLLNVLDYFAGYCICCSDQCFNFTPEQCDNEGCGVCEWYVALANTPGYELFLDGCPLGDTCGSSGQFDPFTFNGGEPQNFFDFDLNCPQLQNWAVDDGNCAQPCDGVLDCVGLCVPQETYDLIHGDGFCDDGGSVANGDCDVSHAINGQCINLNCVPHDLERQQLPNTDCNPANVSVECDGEDPAIGGDGVYDCSLLYEGTATACFDYQLCIGPLLMNNTCENGIGVVTDLPDACNGIIPRLDCLCSPSGMDDYPNTTMCEDFFFNCDEGSCGTWNGGDDGDVTTGQCITSCEDQGLCTDCDGVCYSCSFASDSSCDDGRDGPNFLCEEYGYDTSAEESLEFPTSPCCTQRILGNPERNYYCPSLIPIDGLEGEDAEWCSTHCNEAVQNCNETIGEDGFFMIADCDGECIQQGRYYSLLNDGICHDGITDASGGVNFLCEYGVERDGSEGIYFGWDLNENTGYSACCEEYCIDPQGSDDWYEWCYDAGCPEPGLPTCSDSGQWTDCDGNCFSTSNIASYLDVGNGSNPGDCFCDDGSTGGPNLMCKVIKNAEGFDVDLEVLGHPYDLPGCCIEFCFTNGDWDPDKYSDSPQYCPQFCTAAISCPDFEWNACRGSGSCGGPGGEYCGFEGNDGTCSCDSSTCLENNNCCCDFYLSGCYECIVKDCDGNCLDDKVELYGEIPGQWLLDEYFVGDGYCDNGSTSPIVNLATCEYTMSGHYSGFDGCDCMSYCDCDSSLNLQNDYCSTPGLFAHCCPPECEFDSDCEQLYGNVANPEGWTCDDGQCQPPADLPEPTGCVEAACGDNSMVMDNSDYTDCYCDASCFLNNDCCFNVCSVCSEVNQDIAVACGMEENQCSVECPYADTSCCLATQSHDSDLGFQCCNQYWDSACDELFCTLCPSFNSPGELECTEVNDASCHPTNEFDCNGDGTECIPASYVCDGQADCINGADEQDCPDDDEQNCFAVCNEGAFYQNHGFNGMFQGYIGEGADSFYAYIGKGFQYGGCNCPCIDCDYTQWDSCPDTNLGDGWCDDGSGGYPNFLCPSFYCDSNHLSGLNDENHLSDCEYYDEIDDSFFRYKFTCTDYNDIYSCSCVVVSSGGDEGESEECCNGGTSCDCCNENYGNYCFGGNCYCFGGYLGNSDSCDVCTTYCDELCDGDCVSYCTDGGGDDCEDCPGYTDDYGDDCSYYDESPWACGLFDEYSSPTANEACCACGGGTTGSGCEVEECQYLELIVGGSELYDYEISWTISDDYGNEWSGAAGTHCIDLVWGYCFTFTGNDSFGDGWNGATATLTDTFDGSEIFNWTLDSGGSGSFDFGYGVSGCGDDDDDGGSGGCTAVGDGCGGNGICDCQLGCIDQGIVNAYLGDGSCDDGTYGDGFGNAVYLNCSYFDNDNGDCDENDDDDDGGSGGCDAGQWECDNGQCIPDSWECDGYVDCSDGSDEAYCGDGESGGCCTTWGCDGDYSWVDGCDCYCGGSLGGFPVCGECGGQAVNEDDDDGRGNDSSENDGTYPTNTRDTFSSYHCPQSPGHVVDCMYQVSNIEENLYPMDNCIYPGRITDNAIPLKPLQGPFGQSATCNYHTDTFNNFGWSDGMYPPAFSVTNIYGAVDFTTPLEYESWNGSNYYFAGWGCVGPADNMQLVNPAENHFPEQTTYFVVSYKYKVLDICKIQPAYCDRVGEIGPFS